LATSLLTLIVILGFLPMRGLAMELEIIGNQIILSGPVVGDEPGKLREVLARSPGIDTVILRNSLGGNAPSGYRVGELLRERSLRTAVSGYCYSSCSRMLLGGSTRYFTDDYPAEYTNVGFHGHYDAKGRLDSYTVRQYGLGDWIIKYSDGKADPLLVERWINIPYSRGMIHFFHPGLVKHGGTSTFMCQGEEAAGSVFACERIDKTALDLGVVTSLEIVHSADQAELRAAIPIRPRASGFASITDSGKVPLSVDRGLEEYRRFLNGGLPRAFAISPDGKYWAWNAGTFDAVSLAIARCAERSHQQCQLYAVDEDVVWMPK